MIEVRGWTGKYEDGALIIKITGRDTETGQYKKELLDGADLPPGLAKNINKVGDFRPNRNALKKRVADLFNVKPNEVKIPPHIEGTGKIEDD